MRHRVNYFENKSESDSASDYNPDDTPEASLDQWTEEGETPIEHMKKLWKCESLQKVEERTKHNNLMEEEGKTSSPGEKKLSKRVRDAGQELVPDTTDITSRKCDPYKFQEIRSENETRSSEPGWYHLSDTSRHV